MKNKEITTKRFRTSALFDCLTCGVNWEDYRTSRQEAYKHAKETGHKVRGEIATSYHYNH